MRGASSFVSRDQQTLPLSAHFTVELWMTSTVQQILVKNRDFCRSWRYRLKIAIRFGLEKLHYEAKIAPFIFFNNFVEPHCILTIFGTQIGLLK